MNLSEKLETIKRKSAETIPETSRAVMSRGTQQIADSLAERDVPSVGDKLPPFSLSDSQGRNINSRDLADQGPFIVTLFRGKW